MKQGVYSEEGLMTFSTGNGPINLGDNFLESFFRGRSYCGVLWGRRAAVVCKALITLRGPKHSSPDTKSGDIV